MSLKQAVEQFATVQDAAAQAARRYILEMKAGCSAESPASTLDSDFHTAETRISEDTSAKLLNYNFRSCS